MRIGGDFRELLRKMPADGAADLLPAGLDDDAEVIEHSLERDFFEKDCKLEWKLVLALAIVQFANSAVLIQLGRVRQLIPLLVMTILVGIAFLIASVVYQDAIPGVRQDWLVRPIQRKDLLLAKFLFVVIAVHGPMLLADLFRDLANGFGFGASLASALSRSLFILFALSLPLLAFASLTKNILEAIAAALLVILSFVAFTMLLDATRARQLLGESSIAWIQVTAQALVGLLGAAVVLGLQYFRRRTIVARGLAAAAIAGALLTMFVPWNTAFAVQERLSTNPDAASSITVAFDPSIGKFTTEAAYINDVNAFVFLPLRFEHLPAGSVLISDRAELRIQNETISARHGVFDGSVSVWQEDGDGPAAHLMEVLPGELYQRVQDQPENLEIELSLTLFAPKSVETVPALNGKVHTPDLGWCTTGFNIPHTAIRLACVPLEKMPPCLRIRLHDAASGLSNPPISQCQGNYTPFNDALYLMPPEARDIPFRDLDGRVKFPIAPSQLPESQIQIQTYQPIAHFTRTVQVPDTKLKDWTAKQ